MKKEMDFSWLIKQVRNQKLLYEYLLTEKERLLLKFNDQHVLDSDDDKAKKYGLGSSDSDLLGEYHIDKDNERASAIRQTLLKMLNKRVKRPS